MSNLYFFDTYAFFEVIRGNQNYKKYIEVHGITTVFNLAELNYNLKKEKSKAVSDDFTEKYKIFLVEVTVDDIKKAMDLKIKKKYLSIPDAIGYTIARKYNVPFLTGDSDFKDIPYVEFVR